MIFQDFQLFKHFVNWIIVSLFFLAGIQFIIKKNSTALLNVYTGNPLYQKIPTQDSVKS